MDTIWVRQACNDRAEQFTPSGTATLNAAAELGQRNPVLPSIALISPSSARFYDLKLGQLTHPRPPNVLHRRLEQHQHEA